jgi:hypothetical protein
MASCDDDVPPVGKKREGLVSCPNGDLVPSSNVFDRRECVARPQNTAANRRLEVSRDLLIGIDGRFAGRLG